MSGGIRIVRAGETDAGTGQTPGMTRRAGVSQSTCGATGVWLGEVSNAPGFRSAAHHHGRVESAIYVLRGRMRVRWGDGLTEQTDADAGDYIFVPANLVHQEINLSPDEPLIALVARGGDNIVVNVEAAGAERP